jgi:protein tyrosine phosphatase
VALVQDLAGRLRHGRRLVVHCYGGKGRSGMLVGALLLTLQPPVLGWRCNGLIQDIQGIRKQIRRHRKGVLKNMMHLYFLHALFCHFPQLLEADNPTDK